MQQRVVVPRPGAGIPLSTTWESCPWSAARSSGRTSRTQPLARVPVWVSSRSSCRRSFRSPPQAISFRVNGRAPTSRSRECTRCVVLGHVGVVRSRFGAWVSTFTVLGDLWIREGWFGVSRRGSVVRVAGAQTRKSRSFGTSRRAVAVPRVQRARRLGRREPGAGRSGSTSKGGSERRLDSSRAQRTDAESRKRV
jgi:hypothetical protein